MTSFPAKSLRSRPTTPGGIARAAGRAAIAAVAVAFAGGAFALANNTDPGGNPPPLDVTVSGTLTFRGCVPTPNEVTVRVSNPARTGHPSAAIRLADGSIRMKYSIVVGRDGDPRLPAQFTVTPRVDPAACGSAGFAPSSRVAAQYATTANFDFQASAPQVHFIQSDLFVLFANSFLSQVRLHLNNDGTQSSFVTIGDATSSFDIPPEEKDLPFPLPGSGRFFIRNMNLDLARMSRTDSAFDVKLRFEGNGVEVKGYHSTLGDLAMPDFQMNNTQLDATPTLGVRHGKLVMGFTNLRLQSDIVSTGACNVFHTDWCNHLFGASGSLRKAFELHAFTQLNGSLVQAALTQSLSSALNSQGIVGTIGSVAVQGDLIVVTTIQ
jgi:hypothetical protein